MVHLLKMAEFMNNKIVCYLRREQCNLIVEVKVSCSRATSPSGLLILDCYLEIRESVDPVKILQPFLH
jgi:hypothetical protein